MADEDQPLKSGEHSGFRFLCGAAQFLGLLGFLACAGYLLYAFSPDGRSEGLNGATGISTGISILIASVSLVGLGLLGNVLLDIRDLLKQMADRGQTTQ